MSSRPIRDRWEKALEKIPEGPTGAVGSGNLIGSAGYFAVSATDPLFDFVPGVKRPGYTVKGSEVVEEAQDFTKKKVTVNAAGRNVAEFAAKYVTSLSNVDYFRSDPVVVETEPIRERNVYTTWEVTVKEEKKGAAFSLE